MPGLAAQDVPSGLAVPRVIESLHLSPHPYPGHTNSRETWKNRAHCTNETQAGLNARFVCDGQVHEGCYADPVSSFVHFIHLEADCAAVIEIAVGRVVLAHGGHQHVLLVLELLLQHDQEL